MQAEKIMYLWCGVNCMDLESNESVYGQLGKSSKGEGINYGMMKVIKHRSEIWSPGKN